MLLLDTVLDVLLEALLVEWLVSVSPEDTTEGCARAGLAPALLTAISEDRSEFTDFVRFLPPKGEGSIDTEEEEEEEEEEELFPSILCISPPLVPMKPTDNPEVDCLSLFLIFLGLGEGIGDPGESNMDCGIRGAIVEE